VEERSLTARPSGGLPGRPADQTNLADILERVLDKGIVIAGDIQINLLEVELLTIKLRLLIASVDRAREMGINWWESDASLQSVEAGSDSEQGRLEQENRELHERLERLERQLGEGDGEPAKSSRKGARTARG
jgi:Gas vesicle protein